MNAFSASDSETVYPSRVDGWLVAVLCIAPVALLIALVATPSLMERLIILGALAAEVGVVVWLMLGTSYAIARDRLTARCGPLTWRIPLAEITAVKPVRSLASAPALSLRRLAVAYRGRTLMVSPRDDLAFLQDLRARMARVRR